MYFTEKKYTKKQLSTQYKTLCKMLHPDKSKISGEEFVSMKNEYDLINSQMVNDVWVRPVPIMPKVTKPAPVKKTKNVFEGIVESFLNMTPEQLKNLQLMIKHFKK